jgi:hypothetical protein
LVRACVGQELEQQQQQEEEEEEERQISRSGLL